MNPKIFSKLCPLAFLMTITLACADAQKQRLTKTEKQSINGISYTSPSKAVGSEIYQPMLAVNANFVAIIPYAFIRHGQASMQYNASWQWWGERTAGVASLTRGAHEQGLSVMIKPQVWLAGGSFTGTFNAGSEVNWQKFEKSYFSYILHFAKLADSLEAELFCVGTEWKVFAVERPIFWNQLIDSVRAHYQGALTYAGNWDSYAQFPHWQKLDYIGVDAYFPLSSAQNPKAAQLKTDWQPIKEQLYYFQDSLKKPILFTEYGYCNRDYCAQQPWESKAYGSVNLAAQAEAYQALYETFWQESWFAGGFLWKWHSPHQSAGGKTDVMFSPQNKPAEGVIEDWYGR